MRAWPWGSRLNRRERRCFCLTSDGELNEGSIWEAALFIAQHKLTNVIWLIDCNQIQGIGRTEEVMALEPLAEKLRTFGFHVVRADGHDFRSLLAARDECVRVLGEHSASAGKPGAMVANTIKGHGIRGMQDTVASHYLPMDDAQYAQAIEDLTHAHAAAVAGYRHAG